MEQIFQKRKVVTGKTPLFVIGPFLVAILFVLTLAFDKAVLNGTVFPILSAITGALRKTSKRKLYQELGLESFRNRR